MNKYTLQENWSILFLKLEAIEMIQLSSIFKEALLSCLLFTTCAPNEVNQVGEVFVPHAVWMPREIERIRVGFSYRLFAALTVGDIHVFEATGAHWLSIFFTKFGKRRYFGATLHTQEAC